MMKEVLILFFVFSGVFLMFIASLGLFKMPDLYTRMSAVTKAVTFKVGMIMISAMIYFNEGSVTFKALLVIFLLLVTTPVSTHLFGKEAHDRKTTLWKKTIVDELKKTKKKQ